MSNKPFNQQLANIRESVPHEDGYTKSNSDQKRRYNKNSNQTAAKVQPMNSPYTFGPLAWKGDGVDHININYAGKTMIGKKMSDTFVRTFIHPIFGPFDSFFGLSCWLLDPNFANQQSDETYRTSYHEDAQGNSMNLRRYSSDKRFHKYIPNYRYYMLQAYVARIKNTRDLREAIISDEFKEMSFDSYYFMTEGHGGVGWPVRSKNASWLVNGMNAIREAFITKKEVDLSEFIDDPESLMQEPELIRQMRESKKEQEKAAYKKKEQLKKAKAEKPKQSEQVVSTGYIAIVSEETKEQPVITNENVDTAVNTVTARGETTSFVHVDELAMVNSTDVTVVEQSDEVQQAGEIVPVAVETVQESTVQTTDENPSQQPSE